jgi:3-dehydroquinate dehydratase-1/3-dehydroquinate dehydratase/shikimate dehydrogenase
MKQVAKLCIAIGASRLAQALALLKRESEVADLFEIRLDFLEKIAVDPFFSATELPLLFTNRPVWEGGNWAGEESERVAFLVQAARAGAAYIDCELRAPASSRTLLKEVSSESSCRLILSYHDFDMTPGDVELLEIVESMYEQGADIGKIITTAHDHLDVLRVLKLQERAAELGFPLSAFCMGTAGRISRLATMELGGYMTYCSAADGAGTAPGQMSGHQIRSALQTLG